MGFLDFLKKAKEKVREGYQQIDKKYFKGYLPGGEPLKKEVTAQIPAPHTQETAAEKQHREIIEAGGTITYDRYGYTKDIQAPPDKYDTKESVHLQRTPEGQVTESRTQTITKKPTQQESLSTYTAPSQPETLTQQAYEAGAHLKAAGAKSQIQFHKTAETRDLINAMVYQGTGQVMMTGAAVTEGAKAAARYAKEHPVRTAATVGLAMSPAGLARVGLGGAARVAGPVVTSYFGYEIVKYGTQVGKRVHESPHPGHELAGAAGEVGAIALAFRGIQKAPGIIRQKYQDIKTSIGLTKKYKGQIVKAEPTELKDFTTGLEVRIKVRSLEGHKIKYITRRDPHGDITIGTVEPIYSKPFRVTSAELTEIPVGYDMHSASRTAGSVRPLSARPTNLLSPDLRVKMLKTEVRTDRIRTEHIKAYDKPTKIIRYRPDSISAVYYEAGYTRAFYSEMSSPKTPPHTKQKGKKHKGQIGYEPPRLESEKLSVYATQFEITNLQNMILKQTTTKSIFSLGGRPYRGELSHHAEVELSPGQRIKEKPSVFEKIDVRTKGGGNIYTFRGTAQNIPAAAAMTGSQAQILKQRDRTIQEPKIETKTEQKYDIAQESEFKPAQQHKTISGQTISESVRIFEDFEATKVQVPKQATRQATRQATGFISVSKNIQKDILKQGEKQIQINKQIQIEKQIITPIKTTLQIHHDIQTTPIIDITTSRTGKPGKIIEEIIKIPGMPGLPEFPRSSGSFSRLRPTRPKPRQKKAYTPTAISASLKIKSKKKSKIGVMTGLGIRPIQ